MGVNAAFTLRALEILLQQSDTVQWLEPSGGFVPPAWGVARVESTAGVYFVDHSVTDDSVRVFFNDLDSGHSLDRLPGAERRTALQRAHRAALASERLPFRLPMDWAEYHHDSLIAFFATPETVGPYRWILQLMARSPALDVVFWRVTDSREGVALANFDPPVQRYQAMVDAWSPVVRRAKEEFTKLAEPPRYLPLDGTIDLQAATYGAVTGLQNYDRWVGRLTGEQRKFFDHPIDTPLKLRGPAGSGKTLALELKALRELYQATDEKCAVRILFVTHSWAMAEQVDGALRQMDSRELWKKIEVYPLVEVTNLLQPFQIYGPDARPLGSDSYEGHKLLLGAIDECLARSLEGDWLLYRAGVSQEFAERVESVRKSPEWNSLVWDLMHEFSSVLAAARILPGITAEKKYLGLVRAEWMMPLVTDQEKRFVLRVYSDHLADLKKRGLVSTDQMVTDLVNHLESFAWDYRRAADGFDIIFVDEFHLFSDQERQVFNYLGRSAQTFPHVFMALDPRQSPTEAYADVFPVSAVRSSGNRDSEKPLGAIAAVDLTLVHRFSPQILELVKFIHRSYPAFQLGADWLVDTHSLRSSVVDGLVPRLFQHGSPAEELDAIADSISGRGRLSGEHRIAIVLVDDARLDEFGAALRERGNAVVELKSRDDIDKLRYSKRSLILGAAEFVAGLQFEQVIVAGFPKDRLTGRLSEPQMRRILSALYLAVSRASERVDIHIHTEIGDIARLLQRALESGVVERAPASLSVGPN